jgi:hypothetical protein
MIPLSTILELWSVASAADTRFPDATSADDPRLQAWQAILGDTRPEDARDAVLRIVRRPQMQVMQPGHILDEVRTIRSERLAAVSTMDLVPPDDIAPGRYPEWLRAAKRAVGDGADAQAAMDQADLEFGASRRLLGPSMRKPMIEQQPRGLGRVGDAS